MHTIAAGKLMRFIVMTCVSRPMLATQTHFNTSTNRADNCIRCIRWGVA